MNEEAPPAQSETREPLLPPMVATEPIFSQEECARICALGQARGPADGTIEAPVRSLDDLKEGEPLGTFVESSYRKSMIAFVDPDDESKWIYARIAAMVKQVNGRFWRFGIAGAGRLQYSVYQDGGHYDWHMDIGQNAPTSRRKISVSVQLSDPKSYDGGDLLMRISNRDTKLPRKQGIAVLFPSYILHRVTPVTGGVRNALVHWYHGRQPLS